MLTLLLLLNLITFSWALPFFPVNISTIFYTNSNLTCNNYSGAGADLCVIEQDTVVGNSSGSVWTNTTTRTTSLLLSNTFKPLILFQNCSSGLTSNATDIGYATCSARPFQSSTVNTSICICATNNCTASYNSCVASVNAMRAANTAPASLPQNILPTLSNPITCYENTSFFEYSYYNTTSPYYLCMYSYLIYGFYPTANETMCEQYLQNNTVLCRINSFDSALFAAWDEPGISLGIEEYQQWLSNDLSFYLEYVNNGTNGWNFLFVTNYTYQVYESPTSVLYYESFALGCDVFISCDCYCTTNYCDLDMATCGAGLNVNCDATNATIIASEECQNAPLTTNATTTQLSTSATTTQLSTNATTTQLSTNATTAATTVISTTPSALTTTSSQSSSTVPTTNVTMITTPVPLPSSLASSPVTSTIAPSGTNGSNMTAIASTSLAPNADTTSATTDSDQSWTIKLLAALLGVVGAIAVSLGCALAFALKRKKRRGKSAKNKVAPENKTKTTQVINERPPESAINPPNTSEKKNRGTTSPPENENRPPPPPPDFPIRTNLTSRLRQQHFFQQQKLDV